MRRLFAVLALLAATPALAQSPLDVLHVFYSARAAIAHCGIPVEPAVMERIRADEAIVEAELGWPREQLDDEFDLVTLVIEIEAPDCAITSTDLADVHRFVASYRNR